MGGAVQNGGQRLKSAKQATNMSPGKLRNELANEDDGACDVVVVGAGPAGLMLA